MNNIDSLLQEIEGADLFSAIEKADIDLPSVILIPGVGSVFVDPVISAFEGLYDKTEWLPTSTSQEDPFYSKLDVGSELADMRKVITKAVMAATRNCDMSKLACTPDDFRVAARNAICFAFRQLVSENYYDLGNKWALITNIYFLGHWPVGVAEDKIICV